jgi:hypothetical protein
MCLVQPRARGPLYFEYAKCGAEVVIQYRTGSVKCHRNMVCHTQHPPVADAQVRR